MNKKVINSQLRNMTTYKMYERQLLTLAENVFEFLKLNNFIDVSLMNKTLVKDGSIAFFKDDVLGLLALPYEVKGKRDAFNRPRKICVRGYNGTYYRILENTLEKQEFVIMYDNNGRYSIYLDILQMAERIAMNKRTIDINIIQQRTSRIWKTSKDKKKSLEDLLQNIDAMAETVTTFESMEIDEMNVVLAPAPYVADKIDMHLDKEWSEFYRLIGIANLTEQKKERVIRDEMSASQGGTIASRFSRFEPRKRAVEEINRIFNENIEVRYYDGEPTTEKEDIIESEEIQSADI